MSQEIKGTREAVSAHRERDFLRFQDFERTREASLRLDEETDLSERLFMPMESTFLYERREGKLHSEFGDRLEQVFTTGYLNLLPYADERPDLVFEINRRYQDIMEVREAEQLQPGETMVVFSPIPDDVRHGRAQVDAYNRERLKMLVRVYEHSEALPNTFSITSFSLDGSHYQAMQSAAAVVGVEIPDGLSSEEIVQQRHVFAADDERLVMPRLRAEQAAQTLSKSLTTTLRQAYDVHLAAELGGEWYAGRPAISQGNALEFVRSQPEIFAQHFANVKDIMARALDETARRDMLVAARYNCAAALDDVLHGKVVVSIEQAGEEARSEGREYDGDCITTPPTSTGQQAERLGYRSNSLRCVTCPLPNCGKMVDAIATPQGGIACPACNREVRGGRLIDHNIQESHSVAPAKFAEKVQIAEKPKLLFKQEIAIGTAAITAFTTDGTLVATGKDAAVLYRQQAA